MTEAIAVVRHVTRHHVTIAPKAGYSVTIFTVTAEGAGVEAIVAADNGTETVRLLVAAPHKGESMSIQYDAETNVTNIFYRVSGR